MTNATIKKKEKIIIALITILIGLITIASIIAGYLCDTSNTNDQLQVKEQLTTYYEIIDVVVVSNDYKYWYASGSHNYTEITVKSEDGLEQTFELDGMDATKYKNCQEGDVIQAELCVWKNSNTGETIKREIDCLD